MKRIPVLLVDGNYDVKIRVTTNKKSGMYNVLKEFFFVFVVTFTVYATVLNSQNKTSKGPPPIPFFHKGSVVDDFYKGELHQLMDQISNAGLAFVMYYAPWDADTQDARHEFEQTAQLYFKQVYFAGVNCWKPEGDCRTTFKDITSFPQLVAYIGPQKAIRYRGPYDADHMIRFVHSLLYPINRVNTVTDVRKLRFLHDAVVVGHLKFEGMRGGLPYRVLYETSLMLAGRDHERHTAFAVFTHNKTNTLMDVTSTPTIFMYLWNKRIEYTGELNTSSLHKWIVKMTDGSLSEINSNTLLPHMKSGAVIVLFTPRHPLSYVNPYYQMLRRIAVKFHSCGNLSALGQDNFMVHISQYDELYKNFEQELITDEQLLREECSMLHKVTDTEKCTVSPHHWNNLTVWETRQYCLDSRIRYRERLSEYRSQGLNGKDLTSSDELILKAKLERCALLERAPQPLKPSMVAEPVSVPTICELNYTITFLALDSTRHSHLALGLGLNLKQRKDNTAVVVLTREETLKLGSDEVNENTVSQLLNAYIAGDKNRFLRSSRPKNKEVSPEDKTIHIKELTTRTFQSVVLNNTQSVVVFYHSSYCSFCQAVSHVFLTVAYLLRSLSSLSMTRVDGENNDLPWQYTVHLYPSILIFPAYRKSESRIFPQWLGLTVHSLSHFILANLDVEERVQGMLALCANWGNNPEMSDEGEACLRNVRMTCLEMISETLHSYRSASLRLKHSRLLDQRKYLQSVLKNYLLRLQFLKSAHLRLGHVTDIPVALDALKLLRENPGSTTVRTKPLRVEL